MVTVDVAALRAIDRQTKCGVFFGVVFGSGRFTDSCYRDRKADREYFLTVETETIHYK